MKMLAMISTPIKRNLNFIKMVFPHNKGFFDIFNTSFSGPIDVDIIPIIIGFSASYQNLSFTKVEIPFTFI